MRVVLFGSNQKSLINFRGTLIKELISNGNTVIAIAPRSKNGSYIEEELAKLGSLFQPIDLSRNSLNPFSMLLNYIELRAFLRKICPDLIIAYTAKPVIISGLIAKTLPNCKFFPLVTGLGYAFTKGNEFKRYFVRIISTFLYKLSLSNASKVIFQNQDDEILFRKMEIISSNSKSVIVNGSGVDLDKFPVSELPKSHIFLMVGRLVGDKGVREYVLAAKKVKELYPDAIFKLVGGFDSNPSGIKKSELNDWINEGIIDYLGKLESVQGALAQCRYFVLPSYREGTPRSVLEAMATGRPIITTDVPGCRETVIDGYNGYLVNPRSIDDLVRAMEKLILATDDEVNKMAECSSVLVKAKYDVKLVNEQFLKILNLQ